MRPGSGSAEPVEAVFFDMGGVLLRPGPAPHVLDWCRRLGMTRSVLGGHVQAAIAGGWEAGIEPADIRRRLATRLGVSEDDADDVLLAVHASEQLDGGLVAFVDAAPAVTVGIISNNGPDVRRYWNKVHDLEAKFSPIVISGEERVAKPDRRIFEIAAARAGTRVSQCVLVDDAGSNVAGAVKAGMSAIHHTDSESTLRRLRELISTTT